MMLSIFWLSFLPDERLHGIGIMQKRTKPRPDGFGRSDLACI